MNIEEIRDDIAEELGAIHSIISTLLDGFPSNAQENIAITCDDNAMTLLEYTRGYTDSAFKCLDKLSSQS
jgi:hypothetical protein